MGEHRKGQAGRALAWPGAPLAIASAVLFGASTPFAKLLIGAGTNPWLLAGLLYLGSGIGLGLIQLVRILLGTSHRDAPLTRADMPWLALIVLTGGVVGPVLLMIGLRCLRYRPQHFSSILKVSRRWQLRGSCFARMSIAASLPALSPYWAVQFCFLWQGGPAGFGLGALAIAGACLAWGVDNNLTRKLSSADPVQIALIKGLVAGCTNLVLALSMGAHLPSLPALGGAAVVGFLGYGVSLVFFVLGLRHLGTARTGAYFSTAPFIGAVLAVVMLHEPLTVRLVFAGVLMAIGLYLHLTEAHAHQHTHEAMDHEHRHVHDAHHQHAHGPGDPQGEPHTHRHHHAPLKHKHAHYPDLHHRHGHS